MDALVCPDIPDEIECRMLEACGSLDLCLAMAGPYASPDYEEPLLFLSLRRTEEGLEGTEQVILRMMQQEKIEPYEYTPWLGNLRLHFQTTFEPRMVPEPLFCDEDMLECLSHFLIRYLNSIDPAILTRGIVIESNDWDHLIRRREPSGTFQVSLN